MKKHLLIWPLSISAFAMAACAALPVGSQPAHHEETYALQPNGHSSLDRSLSALETRHPGKSGFRLLPRGEEAFLMRIAMIEAAERSADLQYYSIQNDRTGKMLLQSLIKAADRGVRVRLLVDDLNLNGADRTMLALNGHKNIEIRAFNPFASANTDMGQMLQRMHNKAFIVDNAVAIAGGRNLADEYFGLADGFNFGDMDIFTAGPITRQLSKSFDGYWNSELSYPIAELHPPALAEKELQEERHKLEQFWNEERERGELRKLIPLSTQLKKRNIRLHWAKAELAADEPEKVMYDNDDAPAQSVSKPAKALAKTANASQRELLIISSYFIPREQGVAWLKRLSDRGVNVRILTNSLASTDVVAAYSGFAPYREALLKNGAMLYEAKPYFPTHREHKKRPLSLHTKLYVADRKDLMIGSFNFDPRSVRHNTEMLLIIHSPELATEIADMFNTTLARNSYQVTLNNGELTWKDMATGKLYDDEPEAGFWRSVKSGLYSVLPEDQL
ncbi:phospholipase D family protein [bacterium]|nr:phospholipase D family protein [bacterium]